MRWKDIGKQKIEELELHPETEVFLMVDNEDYYLLLLEPMGRKIEIPLNVTMDFSVNSKKLIKIT